MNQTNNLKKINEISESNDNLEIIKWLQDLKIIPTEQNCKKCCNKLKLQMRKDVVDAYGWRCTKCSTRKSIRTGTFLESFNICLQTILKLIFFWSIQTRQTDQAEFLDVSRNTIITFHQKLRFAAIKGLNKPDFKLGGENTIVEIDESLFIKVKHFKGKDLKRPQIWVFGMYERRSKRCLFVEVPKRNAFNLLNVIYQYILPNTIIYSDCWSAYSRIRELDKNYQHQTVNHSLVFVNAEDGTHTNGIESIWCSAKTHIKTMRGVSRKYLTSYLDEYCWRQNITESRSDAAICILKEIAKHHNQECDLAEDFSKLNTEFSIEDDLIDVEDVDFNKFEQPQKKEVDQKRYKIQIYKQMKKNQKKIMRNNI